MTDSPSSIFDPAPPKSRYFRVTLWCIGCFAAMLVAANIYDRITAVSSPSNGHWIIPTVFIGLPVSGLILLWRRQKIGWSISVGYFLFMFIGLAITQIRYFVMGYSKGMWHFINWRMDIFLVVALAAALLLFSGDVQQHMAIGRLQRNWTSVIAVVLIASLQAYSFLR